MQREFICGDCMNFLPDFPDNYFDVAVVDPPYGIKEHGGKNRSKYVRQKNGTSIYVPDGGYTNYGWDNKPPDREYFKQLFRVSKNQIIWGCNYFDYTMAGGLLARLPCKVGDIMFRINKGAKNPVIELTVTQIDITTRSYNLEVIDRDCGELMCFKSDIGRTIFLTREEAEKKLEEMAKE